MFSVLFLFHVSIYTLVCVCSIAKYTFCMFKSWLYYAFLSCLTKPVFCLWFSLWLVFFPLFVSSPWSPVLATLRSHPVLTCLCLSVFGSVCICIWIEKYLHPRSLPLPLYSSDIIPSWEKNHILKANLTMDRAVFMYSFSTFLSLYLTLIHIAQWVWLHYIGTSLVKVWYAEIQNITFLWLKEIFILRKVLCVWTFFPARLDCN